MKKSLKSLTHDSVPASVKLVKSVRSELRADIRSVDQKVVSLQSEIKAVESKLDSKFSTLDSKIEKTIASSHRIEVLMEEQRTENRIVLDGLKNMMERQDRLETGIKEVRRF